MSEYLTPEEVDVLLPLLDLVGRVDYEPHDLVRLQVVEAAAKLSATLRAYAEVVEAVADTNPVAYYESRCVYCDAWEGNGHKPDCPYPLARELRGHAE